MRIFKSFVLAFSGIIHCIINERHMRIHTIATLYVFVFSMFFDFTRIEYMILCLTVSLILSCEMMNTAIEEITDLSSSSYNPFAKVAKDIAAGAVLLSAIFAVVIGVFLFWQPEYFPDIISFFFCPLWRFILLLFSIALSLYYIFSGPTGISKIFILGRKKIHKG